MKQWIPVFALAFLAVSDPWRVLAALGAGALAYAVVNVW